MEVPLREILVKSHTRARRYIPIQEHPYYAALDVQNPAIYRQYVRRSSYQSSKSSGTWSGFVALARNVGNNISEK